MNRASRAEAIKDWEEVVTGDCVLSPLRSRFCLYIVITAFYLSTLNLVLNYVCTDFLGK